MVVRGGLVKYRTRRAKTAATRGTMKQVTMLMGAALVGTWFSAATANAGSSGVTGEAVDHFQKADCTPDPAWPDIACISQMDNLRNGLVNAPGTIFTAGLRYIENDVFDTDFTDPNVSNPAPHDADNNNFDKGANGIAVVCT